MSNLGAGHKDENYKKIADLTWSWCRTCPHKKIKKIIREDMLPSPQHGQSGLESTNTPCTPSYRKVSRAHSRSATGYISTSLDPNNNWKSQRQRPVLWTSTVFDENVPFITNWVISTPFQLNNIIHSLPAFRSPRGVYTPSALRKSVHQEPASSTIVPII